MEINIKKGYDLNLEGSVTDLNPIAIRGDRAAVYPDDFIGLIPKIAVKPGDTVLIGDSLFYDKNHPEVKVTAPMSGIIEAVERGERRHVERIIIRNDFTDNSHTFDVSYSTPEEALKLLADSGMLALLRQRPYGIVPDPNVRPDNIFVSGFDSAPLAVDPLWTVEDNESLQKAADILTTITKGKVYLSIRPTSLIPNLNGITIVKVSGPHPAGIPGIQAANIKPVSKGQVIWTMKINTMIRIGRLLRDRHIDSSTLVAVTGSGVKDRCLVRTTVGVAVEPLLRNRLSGSPEHLRIISGNVLTGRKISMDGYLRYPYNQITVIPEGDDKHEFMGWASLSPKKLSVSPSFPGRFLHRLFNPDARINGGRRAIIMSGEYDRVLPMDIYGEYLIKAIKAKDIDAMERLGIYEVDPEDFALAEALDSSKQPLQAIVREGLDYIRKELQ